MVDKALSLSDRISNDGQEIWDWAAKLGGWAERQQQKRDLRQKIVNMQNECGSCRHWMTRACPREKHNNQTGRSVGPSSRAMKCAEFSMNASDAAQLAKAQAKLEALQKGEVNNG